MAIENGIMLYPILSILMPALVALAGISYIAFGIVLLWGTVVILPFIKCRKASVIQIINVEEYTLYTTVFQWLTNKGIGYEEKYGQILLTELDMLIKIRSSQRGTASIEVSTIPGKAGRPGLLYELRAELEDILSQTPYPKLSVSGLCHLIVGIIFFTGAAVFSWYWYSYIWPDLNTVLQYSSKTSIE